jgi:N-acetylglucosaminyl-diphospho-decaprenol L-rhamnosyltransferase
MGARVCAVVVTYNSASVINSLLDSIAPAATNADVEVVVVDNGSTDATRQVLARRSDCRVVASVNEGYAGGVMRGTRAASPFDAVLLLNPDVRLEPGAVDAMVTTLAEPQVGIVAPMVLTVDGEVFRSLRREPTLWRALGLNRTRVPLLCEYVTAEESYRRAGDADWALGAALMVSAECLRATGGLDASFFLYSEETDLCLRARDLGWRTRYEPEARVVHIGGASGRDEVTYTMQVLNRVRLYRRRHGAAASWAYFVLIAAREAAWAPWRTPARHALTAIVSPRRRPPQLGCSDQLMPA